MGGAKGLGWGGGMEVKLDDDDTTLALEEAAASSRAGALSCFFCLMQHTIQHRLLLCTFNLYQVRVPCNVILICIVLCHAI